MTDTAEENSSPSNGEKVTGTVKWFSNKYGYGFITPTSDNSLTTDIFVHQTNIVTDEGGFRTLHEGSTVEFEVATDTNTGKLKAQAVTAPGGTPCPVGEKRKRLRNKKGPKKPNEGDSEPWYAPVVELLAQKKMDPKNGRVDIAIDQARITLERDSHARLAHADGYLAEGGFACDESGVVALTWEKVLVFSDEEWKLEENHPENIPKTVQLSDDAVGPIASVETPDAFWGDVGDPNEALEANGFHLRRIPGVDSKAPASKNARKHSKGRSGRRGRGRQQNGKQEDKENAKQEDKEHGKQEEENGNQDDSNQSGGENDDGKQEDGKPEEKQQRKRDNRNGRRNRRHNNKHNANSKQDNKPEEKQESAEEEKATS